MHSGERAVRDENARRKQQRILQVREQSKEIAAKLRKRIHDERERQKDHVEKLKIDELRKWRDGRVVEQQRRYDHLITSTLDANEEAKRELEANFCLQQRKHELDLLAVQRGRTALRKELNDRISKPVKKLKPRSKSAEVQTDHVSFAESPKEDDRGQHIRIDLPPESFDHDDPVISNRSVDILEKSKRFVEDANRRLNEISAKVASCQAGAFNPVKQPEAEGSSSLKEIPRSPPLPSFHKKKTSASPIKTVRINNTTRLRCNLQRPAVADKKVTKRPKKVIPSAVENPRPHQPDQQSVVVCYDHPNRFTKTYDIPKNVVVKNLDHHEDDAVTNALNETLTQIDEEKAKAVRSQELRRKEAVRELEAIEKSQVRRDYEMLAKTLDEVRKARSNSPSGATSGQQFVSGSVSMQNSSSAQNMPLASAATEDILHVPIRISCPKVDASAGQRHLNVGNAAAVDKDDFSGSDSAQTILLDQVGTDEQVVVVTENNAPNLRIRATRERAQEGKEPVKILIQVESVVRQVDRDPPPLDVARQSRDWNRVVDESLSTNYMSPPSEIDLQLNRYLKSNPKSVKGGKAKPRQQKNDPKLRAFVTKLLQMPPAEVEQLSESDVSDVPTPTNSVINVKTNVSEPLYDDRQLSSVSRIIEDNYSILEEVDELIARNSQTGGKAKKAATTSKEETVISTESILHRYATMSQNYNDRIHSLTKMIKTIRAEKESLLHDNGLSTVSMSERDTSTKYKDFASVARTITSSGSDGMSNDSGDMSGSKRIDPAHSKSNPALGANKIIGLSRDSGISMSRPVTSTEVRENVEERTFEPMLKDIQRQKPLEVHPTLVEPDKKRPPNSIARYSPEAIQAAGHDLSTIIEVDTPGTLTVPTQEPVVSEMKKFPTIEEFVMQNGVNMSLVSEADRTESVPVKSFVSFKQFVATKGAASSANDDLELNLSEIAEELRRRSLLADDSNRDKENDEKKSLRSLSRELEEMIQRINSHGLKEPHGLSMSSLRSQSSDGGEANETTIGQLMDRIRPNKFPTREEFNLQKNEEHYKSAEILKSFLNGSLPNTAQGEEKSDGKGSRRREVSKKNDAAENVSCQGQSSRSSGSGSNKKSSDSFRSQTLNLSDDLMNALENNLSEMGLKWAVNMLKRSHNQLSASSSSRGSSSEENLSKEHLPFESKTMSLLTDLEKSSISDESKTSNIKNIILRELIKSKSGNSSSSLSSSNMERRLLNGTGSDDGRCLRTSTPVNSNIYNSISTSTIVDRDRTAGVDISECLFSGESKLSSVKDEAGSSHHHRGLNIPDVQLDTGKYARADDTVSMSTEYSLNEHNKRKLTRRVHK